MKNVLLPSVCRGCDGRASSGPSPFALDPDKGARQPEITQQQSRISGKKTCSILFLGLIYLAAWLPGIKK